MSLTNVFRSNHWVFPLLGCAGFPFWWLEVVTRHFFATDSTLYCLSDDCFIRRAGTSSSFWSYWTVELTLDVFRWTCVLQKTQIYRMLSSYVLGAKCIISGFAVAIWTNWLWNYSHLGYLIPWDCRKQRWWIVIDCCWIDCGIFSHILWWGKIVESVFVFYLFYCRWFEFSEACVPSRFFLTKKKPWIWEKNGVDTQVIPRSLDHLDWKTLS